MGTIKNSAELRQAIADLEKKIDVQEVQMKDKAEQLKANLQPKNLAKNGFSYIAESPEIQKTFVNTLIGFVMGFAFKKGAEILNDKSMDRMVKNMLHYGMEKLNKEKPHSILNKTIHTARKFTPPDSSLYQYLHYQPPIEIQHQQS
jgi:hypothetical protein